MNGNGAGPTQLLPAGAGPRSSLSVSMASMRSLSWDADTFGCAVMTVVCPHSRPSTIKSTGTQVVMLGSVMSVSAEAEETTPCPARW